MEGWTGRLENDCESHDRNGQDCPGERRVALCTEALGAKGDDQLVEGITYPFAPRQPTFDDSCMKRLVLTGDDRPLRL